MWTLWGIFVGVAAPSIIGWLEYRFERAGKNITLTPREWVADLDPQNPSMYRMGDKLVDFAPRMQQYTKTAELQSRLHRPLSFLHPRI